MPDFANTVDTEVGPVHPRDLVPEQTIAVSTGRSWPAASSVVRGRGDLQHSADRLDPKVAALCLDVAGHLGGRGSSSRAKKDAADLRISFARRSSLTSRSSSRRRVRSLVVRPARAPLSTSARLTHFRNVSGVMPHFVAIEVSAAH